MCVYLSLSIYIYIYVYIHVCVHLVCVYIYIYTNNVGSCSLRGCSRAIGRGSLQHITYLSLYLSLSLSIYII